MARINRRQYVRGAGIAITGALAGCSGDGGSGGNESGGDGGSGGNESGGDGGTTIGDSSSGADYKTTIRAATVIDAVNSDYVTTSIESLKENIESETNGEISVEIYPAGQIGSQETGIMQRVQQGTIEFGDTSVQNFAPVAPSFDIKNLPYFAGKNQKFVNLVTSDAWQEIVEPQANDRGFEVFSYGFNDSRCWAPGNQFRGEQPPLTPEELQNANITQRTGGSPFTNTAFEMLGANPTPIGWGEAPTAIQEGTANAMYNAPQYHANSGFADLLSHEVVINAVHDGRVWAMSYKWFNSLPDKLQQQVKSAGVKTTNGNAKRNSDLRKSAVNHLQDSGIEFHVIDGDRLEKWKDAIAYDRNDEWNDLMSDVIPSEEARTQLEEATQRQSDIQINNLQDVL